jgi:protein-L-isoaspartate(D-aspartate) O-methyltransferase
VLGYYAALLVKLVGYVYSVEIVEEFASEAESRVRQAGYLAVEIRVGDGARGWAEYAPYDKIVVTAAADQPPLTLLDQLKHSRRMVLPMGVDDEKVLTVVHRNADGDVCVREIIPMRFTRLETVI